MNSDEHYLIVSPTHHNHIEQQYQAVRIIVANLNFLSVRKFFVRGIDTNLSALM